MASNLPPPGGQPVRPGVPSSNGPPQNFGAPMPMQYRTQMLPGQQAPPPPQFIPPGPPQYRHVMPGQQAPHFPQPGQASGQQAPQFPQPGQAPGQQAPQFPRPGQAPGQQGPVSSQPMQFAQPPARPMPPSYSYGAPQFTPVGVPQHNMGQQWAPVQSVPLVAPLGQQHSTPGVNGQPNSGETVASDWQEHTSGDGKKYYFNKKTRQSSWEKPLELMTPIERADASTPWKEFTTEEGRKYYFNKETKQSKWTIPEELKLARELAEKSMNNNQESAVSVAQITETTLTQPVPVVTPIVAPVTVTTSLVPSPSVDPTATNKDNLADSSQLLNGASAQDLEEAKKLMPTTGKINTAPVEEKTIEEEPILYANKQEAKSAFKALLESCNVESDWTWDQAMRVIINDKRYGALKTLGERKQAFNEYLGQRKKQEAEERRMRQKKAREDFMKMLEECEELTSSTRWSKVASMFEGDERFTAVERSRDREDLFESYLVDLQKKEKAKAAEEHKKNLAEYRAFLESCDFIKVNTQWRKVVDRLEDDERCARLEKLDRLEVFQEYIMDLEKEEEEQKRIQKQQQRRQERKNRDEFRKMMEDHIASGVLNAKTHWREYCMQVKHSKPYILVAENTSGSTPKDLFEDVYEELEKKYNDDKTQVKEAMKLGKITLDSSWTLESFKSAVMDDNKIKGAFDINFKLIFEELMEKEKEKEEKEVKRRQRLKEKFTDLLYSIKDITALSSWEGSKALFEESAEYKSLGDEVLAKELFEECISHLKEKQKEKERIREEEKAKKEREREEKEKRREKDKEKREKDRKEKDREREKEKERGDDADVDAHKDRSSKREKDKEKEKDRERKHRKRHHESTGDANNNYSDKDEKEDSKKSRRHSSDHKKSSRKHGHGSDSESENRHKRHKKERESGSRRQHEELEDGELGEDGEIR